MTDEGMQSSLVARASFGLSTPYEAPSGELETLIAKIFADLFKSSRVGANDDFFDMGGDSLIAEAVSMEILQRTGCEFPMSALLEFGSPRKIAAALVTSESGKDAAKAPVAVDAKRIASLIEMSSSDVVTRGVADDAQIRPPFFVVHGRGGYTLPQPKFLQALAEGQKLRMFELPGIRGGRHYECIEDIAAVYVEQLNQDYPRGPILLASFCAGGLIALEMAKQLAATGRPVQHLVLIDPPVRRNGTLGISNSGGGPPYVAPQDWAASMLRRLLPKFVLLRCLELKYWMHLRRTRKKKARSKYSDFPLSFTPRAKLNFAYVEYRPHHYDGPVTILASRQRESVFRDGSYIANLLPNRTVHLVAERHDDITGPRAAQFMQAAFDAALAEG